MPDDLTPAGQLLEEARGEMSKRTAARLADISEGRWRQIVSGRQSAGGVRIPVNPKRDTLRKMAVAVGADVNAVLVAGGFEPDPVSALSDDPSFARDGEASGEAESSDAQIREELRMMRDAIDRMERRLDGRS